ncbi:MAG: hypothetical protein RL142_965 [Actinomycetota bacterium]
MRELNPIGRDQDTLLLISTDGERFSLHVDEALLKTLKDKKLNDAPGVELTPREIQDAIRAGKTIVELAESSGSSLTFIERFAHPVIEELGHMIDLAKSIRIEMPADRFNEVTKKTFGEIVEDKLHSAGAKSISWSAKRGENSVWEISVGFETDGNEGGATWTFDPRNYLLTPETGSAQSLSNPIATFDTPVPVKRAQPEQPVETVVTEDKLQAFRKRREEAAPVASVIPEPEPEPEPEPVLESFEPEPEPEPVVELTSVQVTEVIPVDIGEESQVEAEPAPEDEPAVKESGAHKKTRAPMPSWDEIVRGTQTDEGESF